MLYMLNLNHLTLNLTLTQTLAVLLDSLAPLYWYKWRVDRCQCRFVNVSLCTAHYRRTPSCARCMRYI